MIVALLISAVTFAMAASELPEYDIKAYCAQVAEMSGSSYIIEKGCRDMEINAKAALEKQENVEARIMEYCNEVSQMSGGSYTILNGCITMERDARDALREDQ